MSDKHYKELLEKFLSGDSSFEENKQLDALLGEHPDAEFDDLCKNMWDSASAADNLSNSRKLKMKDNLLSRVSVEEDCERRIKHSGKKNWSWVFSFAAVIAVFILGGALVYMNTQPVLEYEVLAERGQKSSLILPDGSRVWLNSDSRICYSSDFNKKNRNIVLEGEAYFEVAKNKKIPFIVKASGLDVTAVGTKFNVRNYPKESTVCATLVEGRVLACSKGLSAYLDYGEEAVMERSSGAMSTGLAADLNHLVPWRSSEILFSDHSLAQLSEILSRMYNVDVCFESDEIKDYKYTGLVRNNSLHNVLELVSNTSPVNYELKGNIIVFSESN